MGTSRTCPSRTLCLSSAAPGRHKKHRVERTGQAPVARRKCTGALPCFPRRIVTTHGLQTLVTTSTVTRTIVCTRVCGALHRAGGFPVRQRAQAAWAQHPTGLTLLHAVLCVTQNFSCRRGTARSANPTALLWARSVQGCYAISVLKCIRLDFLTSTLALKKPASFSTTSARVEICSS